LSEVYDKNINTFQYHPDYHPLTHASPRLHPGLIWGLEMIPGLIWKRSCINLYIQHK